MSIPKFRIEWQLDNKEKEGAIERDLFLDEQEFQNQRLEYEDELYGQLGSFVCTKTITALEQTTDAVAEGDVVWRGWYDCDMTSAEGRKQAIGLLRSTKQLWRDRGDGYDGLLEMLQPDERDIKSTD